MNQFTTETIINSFYDAKNKPLFEVIGNKFIAKKLFAFNLKDIKAIYKAEAEESVNEECTIEIPKKAHEYVLDGATKASDIYRLHIEMKTVDANISEFQNSLTRNKKEYNFEVKFDEIAKNIEKAINMQNRESKNKKFDVDVTDSKIVLTSIDGFTRFAKVELQALEENLTGYNAYYVDKEGKVTKDGNSGFGTTNWLMRNFRIPTYVNTNWLSLRQDDRPIPGVKYNQYTFHVESDRGELTGMGAVGQKMTSKTTHVLYVNENYASDFEDLLKGKVQFVDYDCNIIGDEAGDFAVDAVSLMKDANEKKRSAINEEKNKVAVLTEPTNAETVGEATAEDFHVEKSKEA